MSTPRLWHLIQAHQPAGGHIGPDSYLEKIFAPMARLERALVKITNERDVEAASRTARVLWSAIHGIVQVATTAKFGALPLATTKALVEELVGNFLAGLLATIGSGGRCRRGSPATGCPGDARVEPAYGALSAAGLIEPVVTSDVLLCGRIPVSRVR